jgi:hypothetical protein
MDIVQKILNELKEAMKAGRSFEAGVFRMLISAFHNKEIEKKGKGGPARHASQLAGVADREEKLTEEEALDILAKEAKKRKESVIAFEKGGRPELADKEREELKIIEKYLPEQLPREEIEKAVLAAIAKTGAKEVKDFGLAMKEAMAELKGKADASAVSEILRDKLK